MSRASQGASFERQVRGLLEGLGWYVTRAAGSRGPVDLLAVGPGEVLFVQAKLGGPGRLAPVEWNALFALSMVYGGVPLLAPRPRRGRLELLRLLDLKMDRGTRGPSAPCEAWVPYRAYGEVRADA